MCSPEHDRILRRFPTIRTTTTTNLRKDQRAWCRRSGGRAFGRRPITNGKLEGECNDRGSNAICAFKSQLDNNNAVRYLHEFRVTEQ